MDKDSIINDMKPRIRKLSDSRVTAIVDGLYYKLKLDKDGKPTEVEIKKTDEIEDIFEYFKTINGGLDRIEFLKNEIVLIKTVEGNLDTKIVSMY